MKEKGSVLIEALVSCAIFALSVIAMSTGAYLIATNRQKQYEILCCTNIAYEIHEFYSVSDDWISDYLSFSGCSFTIENNVFYYDSEFNPIEKRDQYELHYTDKDSILTLSFFRSETMKGILEDILISEDRI